jgi:hypothetical protein
VNNSGQSGKIGRDAAETVAAQALAWVAGDAERINGFLNLSGLSPEELMAQAGDPRIMGAVLDYLLTEDRHVMEFCDEVGLAYTVPQAARAALPGGEVWHWT